MHSSRTIAAGVCLLVLAFATGAFAQQAGTTCPVTEPSTMQATPSAGFKKIMPLGMLLNTPATQPTCSKLPTSYELGSCFQLDRTHCLLVVNLDEQGGPDLCVGNDGFIFEKLSDIKPGRAIVINRAEPEFKNRKGEPCFLAKYPVDGFFVPLGATLPNGQPHPAAGTGLLISICVAYAPDRSDPTAATKSDSNWKSWETLFEFIQVRWDGQKLTTSSEKVYEILGQPVLYPPFGLLAAVGDGFVGPAQFADKYLRPVRFDWDGKKWAASKVGEPFAQTTNETESTIVRQKDRYLISTRDDKQPKVRIYSSQDGMDFKFLFEAKNHYVPRTLNRGLDDSVYLMTNPGPGFLRNPLLAYPMVGDSFGEPTIIHDQDGVRDDKGDKIPFVDHGKGFNVFLEGRWRHLVFYRVCDLKERTLYGFQKAMVKQLQGDKGPIPKRPTSGTYAAEIEYDKVICPPFVFAE